MKVATPFTAGTDKVPEDPDPVARPTVTVSANPTSVRPAASRAVTTGCPLRAAPLTEPAGWAANASCVATTSAVRLALLAAVRLPLLACRAKASWSAIAVYVTVRPLKVATPDTAAALLLV